MRMRASFFLIHLGSSFFLIHLGFSNMWWWWWQWRWWWRWEGGVEEGRCYFRGATGPGAVIPLACGRLELGLWPCGRLDTMVAGPVAVDMSCIATDPLGQRRLDPTATPWARGRGPQSRRWEQRGIEPESLEVPRCSALQPDGRHTFCPTARWKAHVLLLLPDGRHTFCSTARWKAHVLSYCPMEGTRTVLLPDGRHTFCPTVKYMRK